MSLLQRKQASIDELGGSELLYDTVFPNKALRYCMSTALLAPPCLLHSRPQHRTKRMALADAGLTAAYEQLAASAGALDLNTVRREAATLRPGCDGAPATALPFDAPPGSIRLVVAPVAVDDDTLAVLHECSDAVAACFAPEHVFRTPRSQFHVTLFHFGRPGDVRELPADGGAGLASELALCTALCAQLPPFALVVDSVVFAASGVLLLLLQTTEAEPTPFRVRRGLRATHPAAPPKQSVLLHSSQLRVLAGPTLPAAEAAGAAQRACAAATGKLRGRVIAFDRLWHVQEVSLPCDGLVTELPLGTALA